MTYRQAETVAVRVFAIAMLLLAAVHTYKVVQEVRLRAALVSSTLP